MEGKTDPTNTTDPTKTDPTNTISSVKPPEMEEKTDPTKKNNPTNAISSVKTKSILLKQGNNTTDLKSSKEITGLT